MKNLVRISAAAALIALATAAPAPGQTPPPSGGVSSLDISASGISVTVDPQSGAKAGVDAGDKGSLSLDAGPQGVNVGVKPGAAASIPGVTPQPTRQDKTPSSPQRETGGAAPATATPAAPQRGSTSPASSDPGKRAARGAGGGARDSASKAGSASRGAGALERSVKTNSAASKDEKRGVAPVLDLIEQIPRAVWAGLVALALIAFAMWMLWIQGRRRLERNAWVDAESGAMNVVAFETLLAQEWTRSMRYQRPLGLLLLELEEEAGDGGRRPLAGKHLSDARDAITERTREADTVAQLSATRFAVICPESSHGSVETLARALEGSLEVEQVHAHVGIGERLDTDRGPADLVSRTAAGLDAGTWTMPAAPEATTVESPALHAAA